MLGGAMDLPPVAPAPSVGLKLAERTSAPDNRRNLPNGDVQIRHVHLGPVAALLFFERRLLEEQLERLLQASLLR